MRMSNHPIVFQIGSLVLNCSTVSNIMMSTDDDGATVIIGFHGVERTIRLQVEDHEAALLIISGIKKGIFASMPGYYGGEQFGFVDDHPSDD